MTNKKVLLICLIFLTIFVSGCLEQESYWTEYDTPPVLNALEMEKSIHGLINGERRKIGLGELDFDEELATIARMHSIDMAEKDYFSHEDLEGNDFDYRYDQAGYNCSNILYLGAENIFQGHTYKSTYEDGTIAEYATQGEIVISAVEGWMGSPGHRSNILNVAWDKEGIGVYVTSNGDILVTQNFC